MKKIEIPDIEIPSILQSDEEDEFISQKVKEYSSIFTPNNREWTVTDPLREGMAGAIRQLLPDNLMEAEKLEGFIGLPDDSEIVQSNSIMRYMPQEQRDALLRQEAASAKRNNFLGLRDLADWIEPEQHSMPDNALGILGYEALKAIPTIASSVAEFSALGPAGFTLFNTMLGTQNAQNEVYSSLREQGQTPREARENIKDSFGDVIDVPLRAAANIATMAAFKRPISAGSPIAQFLDNVLTGATVAGAGSMAEQSLTNYRKNIDDPASVMSAGQNTALGAGLTGLALGALNWRELRDAQRAYNDRQPIIVDGRDITPPDETSEIGTGNTPPKTPPQSPLDGVDIVSNVPSDSIRSLSQGTLQIPEYGGRGGIQSRYNASLSTRGFTPISNEFSPNASAREIATSIRDGKISHDDALSMLGEAGLTPEQANGFIQTGVNEITPQQAAQPTKPKQPTEIILDIAAPGSTAYNNYYHYDPLEESFSDFAGDNSVPMQDIPDSSVQDTEGLKSTPTVPNLLPTFNERGTINITPKVIPMGTPDIDIPSASSVQPVIPLPETKHNNLPLQRPQTERLPVDSDVLMPPAQPIKGDFTTFHEEKPRNNIVTHEGGVIKRGILHVPGYGDLKVIPDPHGNGRMWITTGKYAGDIMSYIPERNEFISHVNVEGIHNPKDRKKIIAGHNAIKQAFLEHISDFYEIPKNAGETSTDTLMDMGNDGVQKNEEIDNSGFINYSLFTPPSERAKINQQNVDLFESMIAGLPDNEQDMRGKLSRLNITTLKGISGGENIRGGKKEDYIDSLIKKAKHARTHKIAYRDKRIIPEGAKPKGGMLHVPDYLDDFTVEYTPESRVTKESFNIKGKGIDAWWQYFPETNDFINRTVPHQWNRKDDDVEEAFFEHISDFYEIPIDEAESVNPEGSPTPSTQKENIQNAESPHVRLAENVKSRVLDILKSDSPEIKPFSNNELLAMASEVFGGTKGEGKFNPSDAYDALELGVNLAIKEAGIDPSKAGNTNDVVDDIHKLSNLLQAVPTQTTRTEEKIKYQQFSTPPTLAYLVNWLANIHKGNRVLEPSAGTGNLAVFAHNSGAQLTLNELTDRRADILDSFKLGDVYRENAEHIADILIPKLGEDKRPDRVIMNPPFSAAGNRGVSNSNTNGFRHVEQALELLKDGGRLVTILGSGRDGKGTSVEKWLNTHIAKKYNVRAIINSNGKAYQKYGTNFGNIIAVIDKNGPTPKGETKYFAFSGDFGNESDIRGLFDSLSGVRGEMAIKPESEDSRTVSGENIKNSGDELTEQLAANLTEFANKDARYQNAVKNSDEQTARVELSHRLREFGVKNLNNAIMSGDSEAIEFWKQWNDRPSYRKRIEDEVFERTYPKDNGVKEPSQKSSTETSETTRTTPPAKKEVPHESQATEQSSQQISQEKTQLVAGGKRIIPDGAVLKHDGKITIKGLNWNGIDPYHPDDSYRRHQYSGDLEFEVVPSQRSSHRYSPGAYSSYEIRNNDSNWNVPLFYYFIENDKFKNDTETNVDPEAERIIEQAFREHLREFYMTKEEDEEERRKWREEQEAIRKIKPEEQEAVKKAKLDKIEKIKAQVSKESEKQTSTDENSTETENISIYSDYEPEDHSNIPIFKFAKPHPSPMVETTNMKAVHLPPLTYSPQLSENMVKSGAISSSQLEAVAYAGQAFSQKLPTGQTKGFILGDGTGSGKGRTIAAIITDQLNQNHGKGKAVWFSISSDLFNDAKRDIGGIGEDKGKLFELSEFQLGTPVPSDNKGIMFTTYNTLIVTGKKKDKNNDADSENENRLPKGEKVDQKRLQQIIDWLGKDFDGVIAFDECHKLNNLGGQDTGYGKSNPSKSADAARELADALPNAKILYVSATSATDPANLRMFDRAGLWGENTPFRDADHFAEEIRAGGSNAMEMFARDAKALGVFMARSLSWEGVTYRRLTYTLSKTEREMYDEVAQAWRTVDDFIDHGITAAGGDVKFERAKLNKTFRAKQLQCFCFLLTAFKTNAVIPDAQKQLKNGNSVVIQIDSTYDAFIDRILKGKKPEDDLRDVVISPVEDLIAFVEDFFPVQKMEQVKKYRANGDPYIVNELVKDSDGNPVLSREAMLMRDRLIAHLKRVRFNMSPIDNIINALGGLDNVAELTKRKHRLIRQPDGSIIDAGHPPAANKETEAFNNGQKRVIIFSRAGNTGRSFHADKSFKNQQQRVHYFLEGGFSAFNAIQGFGRTQRSNEVSQPEYVVVATDIPGEIRFISAIVRKLGQMGALTAGDRKNNTQGLFSEKDNMDSPLAQQAMFDVINNLLRNAYKEIPDGKAVLRQMGFNPDEIQGNNDIPLKRVFNRILALDLDLQDVFISYFSMEHERRLAIAIQNGNTDIGTENVHAIDAKTIQDTVILQDNGRGIKTRYLELEVKIKSRIRPFDNVTNLQHCSEFFVDQDGNIYAAKRNGEYDKKTGELLRPSIFFDGAGDPIQRYTLFTPDFSKTFASDQLALENKKRNQRMTFSRVSLEKAKELWEPQSSNLGNAHIEHIHMITGVLLPVWQKLKQLKSARVKRVVLPNGTSIIGRTMEPSEVQSVLGSFNIRYHGKEYTVQDVLKELEKPKQFARLFNNWKVKYSTVNGEKRLEILYSDYHDIPELENLGALIEIIGSNERAFIPVGNNDVLQKIIDRHSVTGVESLQSADDILDEATKEINSNIPDDKKLYIIHPSFWGMFGSPSDDSSGNPYVNSSPYSMENPESEERYQASKKADSTKSILWHLKEFGSKVWKGRYDLPELAGDSTLLKAQEWIRGLKRERQSSVHEVENKLRAILDGLNSDDFDLFQRAMALQDLYETRKADKFARMPWGLDSMTENDPVITEYDRIMKHVEKNTRVQNAMRKADVLMENTKDKLIKAAERIGMYDLRDKLKRKHYFRHLVLEYYNMERGGQPRPTFKNPERRGYMKHREGSEKDISSNWILAMGEVFTRMTDDIKILDTLAKLRKEYDKIEELKEEAFKINKERSLQAIMRDLKDVPEQLRRAKAEEILNTAFQAAQAKAMAKLFELAKSGELPTGGDKTLQELAGKMADAGQLENLSRDDQWKISALIGWLSGLQGETEATKAAKRFLKGVKGKYKVMKKLLEDKYLDWKDLIPEDHTLWSPSDSRIVFSANSVPEYILKLAMEGIDEMLGVPISDLAKALSSGGNKQLWCIPTKLADALNSLGKSQPKGSFGKIMGRLMNGFKRWVTIGPQSGRVFKYNWRNFFGDLEAVLQGNPGALRYVKRAVEELSKTMLKGGIATGELAEFEKRGGGLTTEFMSEFENPERMKVFAHLFDEKEKISPAKFPLKFIRGYIGVVTALTNFRESILRYASFLSYLDQIQKNGGTPPFFGMSKKEEVMALSDNAYDMAFKLANENLGAYDQISQNMQWLRDNFILSFASWIEVNFTRSMQMYKNVWQGNSYLEYWLGKNGDKFVSMLGGGGGNGNDGNEPPNGNNGGDFDEDNPDDFGRKVFRHVRKSPVYAMRLAITLAMAAPLWIMLAIYNWLMHGEADGSKLIVGTNEQTGEQYSFNNLGSALDFFNTVGMGTIGKDLKDLFDGRTTLGQLAVNIADGPVSKFWGNFNPFAKSILETAYGKRTFPSALHPTPIRDKSKFIAQSFGFDWYYDWLTDKPHRAFTDFGSSIANAEKPDRSAYFYILSRKRQFEENVLGKYSDTFTQTKRGEALRNARKAADFGDRKGVRKYLWEFYKAGGTDEGLKASGRAMSPLYGLNEDNQLRFLKWLPKDERKILRRALIYSEKLKAQLGL